MLNFERLAFVYFVYLGVMCWLRPIAARRRLQVAGGCAAMGAAIWLVAHDGLPIVRDWAPLVYVLAGYYLSGLTFVRPSLRLEAWLAEWDVRLLGDPVTRFATWPRSLTTLLDLVYMSCFVLLPAGFAVLLWSGHGALADRYWTMVVAAELGAFAPLVVFQTRPPWALEPAPAARSQSVHRATSFFVRHATIRVNTFPSGHTSGSLAIALAIIGVLPTAGLVFLGLALAIAVGCIVGRYHYSVDVVAGAVLALAIWAVVAAVGL